jgi:hypothetical protein
MSLTMTLHETEELAHRESGGIRVSLLWSRADDTLSVRVRDDLNEADFELSVGNASPLDVFHHPFAYAAYRGIDRADSTLEAIAA